MLKDNGIVYYRNRVSGHGYGCGSGSGLGFGFHYCYCYDITDNSIKTNNMVLFHSEYHSFLDNYSGAGSWDGHGFGCGACHNNANITTRHGELAWCNKIIPTEVVIDGSHT